MGTRVDTVIRLRIDSPHALVHACVVKKATKWGSPSDETGKTEVSSITGLYGRLVVLYSKTRNRGFRGIWIWPVGSVI
jgi:hypothetical protein